jgi:hypothetical protein
LSPERERQEVMGAPNISALARVGQKLGSLRSGAGYF